ncbi:MAG: FIST C-terminal domain-containing protein [Bacteroidota bacterium]|nr:FIST C-terminal domain-containing protein [Bacteroidota bacterium]
MKTALYTYSEGRLQVQPGSDLLVPEQVQLVFCFGNKDCILTEKAFELLRQKFPAAHIAFSSAAGAIANNSVIDDCYTVAALQFKTSVVSHYAVNIDDYTNSYEAGKSLMQQINQEQTKYILILSDGQKVNGSELLRGVNEVNGKEIPVSGGLAADGYHFKSTLTGINQTPAGGIIAAIALAGEDLRVNYGTDAGWENFGPEREVTASDHNKLVSIDGKNALDLYKKYLGKEAEGLPGSALFFPLSLRSADESNVVIRTILSIDEKEKSMVFAGDVPVGCKVRFMRANLDKLTQAATHAAQQTLMPNQPIPRFALLVSCVGRKLVLNTRTDDELTAVLEVFGGKTLLSGFYSYGEIAPSRGMGSQLHNQTMTITTFYELEQAS